MQCLHSLGLLTVKLPRLHTQREYISISLKAFNFSILCYPQQRLFPSSWTTHYWATFESDCCLPLTGQEMVWVKPHWHWNIFNIASGSKLLNLTTKAFREGFLPPLLHNFQAWFYFRRIWDSFYFQSAVISSSQVEALHLSVTHPTVGNTLASTYLLVKSQVYLILLSSKARRMQVPHHGGDVKTTSLASNICMPSFSLEEMKWISLFGL